MTLTLDTDTGVICYSVLKWQTPRQNNHLGKEAEDHQGQHLQSVSTTRGKALLSEEEDSGEVTSRGGTRLPSECDYLQKNSSLW